MQVVVIGGGASGMVAAYFSSKAGAEVILLEKNEKLGKKLYITGKGRCNLTNDSSFDNVMANVVTNAKFMTSSLRCFPSEKTVELFSSFGVKLKTERGNRVFPESDKSSDIIKALSGALSNEKVDVHLGEQVFSIKATDGLITEIVTNKAVYHPDRVILATGGVSYPLTGSTGDGYVFSKNMGHTVVKAVPALVPLITQYGVTESGNHPISQLPKLQGLSLKNIEASIIDKNGKKLFSEFGEMLFTEKGMSGPVILTLSSKINKLNLSELSIAIDLKPALDEKTLENRLLREFSDNPNKVLKNIFPSLLPSSMAEYFCVESGLGAVQANSVTKTQRNLIVRLMKKTIFTGLSLGRIEEAIITSGGVSVKEINPKNMRSKLIRNLAFCGEIIDVDALTGGYNLQTAFATAYSAGKNITED